MVGAVLAASDLAQRVGTGVAEVLIAIAAGNDQRVVRLRLGFGVLDGLNGPRDELDECTDEF